MRRALAILVVAILIVAGAVGGARYAWRLFDDYLAAPGPSAEAKSVILPRGAGLGLIVGRLHDAGVIDHPWLFQLAVQLSGQDRSLQAGEYNFPAGVSPGRVVAMLAEGEIVSRRLTVAEGLTVAEVYRLIEAAEGLTGALPPLPAEGSLLPETYLYSHGDSRGELVDRMQKAMRERLAELWSRRAQGLPLATPEEALVLASIVDKETGQSEERQMVAAVFANRLRRGMKLQSDPTIIYALTRGQGPLDRELTRADWELESPYNTYQVVGLPPTPISNPGEASIAAVLNPAKVNYLYFVADGTGGHAFATTLAEHNRNVVHWRRVRDKPPARVEPEAGPPDTAGEGAEAEGSDGGVIPSAAAAPGDRRSKPAAAPPPGESADKAAKGRQSWTGPLPARPE